MSDLQRRKALKTLAATGLGAALAAGFGPSALAQTAAKIAKVPSFGGRRDLKNSFWVGSNLFSFLAEAKTTGGGFTLIDATVPAGAAAPPHTHTREDEIFFLLEGEMEFTSGGVITLAKPGDVVFLPRNEQHSFKVTSAKPARTLTMFTPGGLEGAYKQIATPAKSLDLPPPPPAPTPEQFQQIAKVFAAYGYYFAQ